MNHQTTRNLDGHGKTTKRDDAQNEPVARLRTGERAGGGHLASNPDGGVGANYGGTGHGTTRTPETEAVVTNPPTDLELEEHARLALQAVSCNVRNLVIRAEKGVVTLTGEVEGAAERTRAEEIVSALRGVERVVDGLTEARS